MVINRFQLKSNVSPLPALAYFLAAICLWLPFNAIFAQENAIQTISLKSTDGSLFDASATLGLTLDGGATYTSEVVEGSTAEIHATLHVDPAHTGQSADIYVVEFINNGFMMKDQDGNFSPWDLRLESLEPYREDITLEAETEIQIFAGAFNTTGTHRVWVGYSPESFSGLIYTPKAGRFNVVSIPQPAVVANLTTGFPGTTGPVSGASDPSLAVGNDRVVMISNAEVAISTKSGELIDRKGLHLFFLPAIQPGVSSAGDVAALFDEESGRFFLAENAQLYPQECQPGTCVGFNMLAVSKTATPDSLGPSDWHFYAIDRFLDQTAEGAVATENGGDFDKLGVDEQHLIITSLQSRESNRAPRGPKIRLLDKAGLIAGEAPETWVDIFPDEDYSRFLAGVAPARMYSESPVFFFAAAAPAGYPCGFTVLGIDTAEAYPAVTWRPVSLEGNCASGDWREEGAGRGPQLGGPPIAVAGTGFSTIPVFRDGRLWVANRWQEDFGSGGVSVIRWAELDVSQWPDLVTVVQQGTIGEDKVWSFEPSLTVDKHGNLMIGYHTTSADQYPALNVSFRLASDPPGTMRPGIVVKAGTGSEERLANGRNRFADYSWMVLDPVDETSWIHGQYGTSGAWKTWVSNIQIADSP